MRVFLVQHDLENMAADRNRARVESLMQPFVDARSIPAHSLIVLPEIFSLGIVGDGLKASEAEAVQAADRAFLATLAQTTESWVLGSTVAVTSSSLANLSVLFDPRGVAGLEYVKMHPFSLGGEDLYFEPGPAPRTGALEGFTVQPTVCYDLRFPELYRAGMREGADLISVQANWPESRREHWEVLLRARAIENQSFVIGVNCAGTQRGTLYAGGSRVVSPKGEVLAHAGAGEEVIFADISADHVKSWRRVFPVLKDRRPDGFWSQGT